MPLLVYRSVTKTRCFCRCGLVVDCSSVGRAPCCCWMLVDGGRVSCCDAFLQIYCFYPTFPQGDDLFYLFSIFSQALMLNQWLKLSQSFPKQKILERPRAGLSCLDYCSCGNSFVDLFPHSVIYYRLPQRKDQRFISRWLVPFPGKLRPGQAVKAPRVELVALLVSCCTDEQSNLKRSLLSYLPTIFFQPDIVIECVGSPLEQISIESSLCGPQGSG